MTEADVQFIIFELFPTIFDAEMFRNVYNLAFSLMFSNSLTLFAMLFFARFTMGQKAQKSCLIVAILLIMLPIPAFFTHNLYVLLIADAIYSPMCYVFLKLTFPKIRISQLLFVYAFIFCFSSIPYGVLTANQYSDYLMINGSNTTFLIFLSFGLTAICIVPCIILFVTKPRHRIAEIISVTPQSILIICAVLLLCIYVLNITMAPNGLCNSTSAEVYSSCFYQTRLWERMKNPQFENTPEALAEIRALAEQSAARCNDAWQAGFILILELLLCILMPIFMVVSASNKHLRQQNELFEKQIEAQAEHYRNLAAANAEVRRFRHDFKNVRFALEKLLAEGKKTEALAVMQEFSEALDSKNRYMILFDTGNGIADALLTDKLHRAQEKEASISFKGAIPAGALAPTDLCVLLGNSIDNAIEACEKLPEDMERKITVECNCSSGFLFLTIRNPIAKPVAICDNRVFTTKKDNALHGFGISSMHKVAKKYDGAVKLDGDGGYFTVNIDLCLPAMDVSIAG